MGYNGYLRKPHFLYVIVDPRTKQPAYVGMTVNPDDRYKHHEYHARVCPSKPLHLWWSMLLREGIKPDMVIVDKQPNQIKARDNERQITIGYLNRGCNLLNDKKVMRIDFQDGVYFVKKSYWKTRTYGRLLTA